MKLKGIGIFALLALAACASDQPTYTVKVNTAVSTASLPTGPVEDFFKANPDVVDYGPNHRLTEPTYLLVSLDDYNNLDQRYKAQGYVRIGVSDWTTNITPYNDAGTPKREYALNFARKIGADRVLYYCVPDINGVAIDHDVAFYAKVN
jgi:hypothetical protein